MIVLVVGVDEREKFPLLVVRLLTKSPRSAKLNGDRKFTESSVSRALLLYHLRELPGGHHSKINNDVYGTAIHV